MEEELENELFETHDGSHSLISRKFGVSYHSKYGAIQESTHVFIITGLLPKLTDKKEEIAILELGFGTGLNALLSLQQAERNSCSIYYETIEAFPISPEMARSLNYSQLLGSEWAAPFLQLHDCSWNEEHVISPFFRFKKQLGLFEDLEQYERFDVVYFDAFAPNAQPELWELSLLKKLYDALHPGGVLVTYCAKGVVKRRLKSLGFEVESPPGPPGKREMIRARKT